MHCIHYMYINHFLATFSGSIAREASDKFHFEISGHVAEFLRPYRQDTCQLGRITSEEDYKFLIKRVSLPSTFNVYPTNDMIICS